MAGGRAGTLEQRARPTPAPVVGFFDGPFSASARAAPLPAALRDLGRFRYPPGPASPDCLAEMADWTPVAGGGVILSRVVVHRRYLQGCEPPYNVMAVRLDAGPVMISNLVGETRAGTWIGRRVRLVCGERPDGAVLPRFVLGAPPGQGWG